MNFFLPESHIWGHTEHPYKRPGTLFRQKNIFSFFHHTFSAFWLRSSVVSVLISLISDSPLTGGRDVKLIFLGGAAVLFFFSSPLGVEEGTQKEREFSLSLSAPTAAMASALHYPQSAVSLSTLLFIFLQRTNMNYEMWMCTYSHVMRMRIFLENAYLRMYHAIFILCLEVFHCCCLD